MPKTFANILGVSDYTKKDKDTLKDSKGKPSKVLPILVKDWDNLGLAFGDLYLFNGKCYDEIDQLKIERLIYNFYESNGLISWFTINKSKEIQYAMKRYQRVVDLELDSEEKLMNLENGVFNMETFELYEHARKYQMSYTLDVNYDPLATACPIFDKFVQGMFATGGSWEEGYKYKKKEVENILRLCGYLIYPHNRVDEMFIMLGEGSNGKSILVDLVKEFFPKKYITSLSLATLSNPEGFGRESLLHSKLNISTEEKSGNIDSEELKRIISGDQISIQRKFQNGATEMIPKTKIALAVNNMPYFNDTTFGTIRRLRMFHFENRFLGQKKYDKAVNPEKYGIFKGVNDKWLMTELQKEKSAIFNKFIEGLRNLKNDEWQFLDTESSDAVLEDYKVSSDVLGTFVREHYEIGILNDFIPAIDIYGDFCEHYLENYGKRTTHSTASLGKKIKEQFRIDRLQRYVEGKRSYGYQLNKRDLGMEEVEAIVKKNNDELFKKND